MHCCKTAFAANWSPFMAGLQIQVLQWNVAVKPALWKHVNYLIALSALSGFGSDVPIFFINHQQPISAVLLLLTSTDNFGASDD
jgi:hypothetical protein